MNEKHFSASKPPSKLSHLSDLEKSYLAGFLDGDGCINAQIVRRKDYQLKFQIRVSVTFFQKSSRNWFLKDFLKKQLKYGVFRQRKDGMSEYSIQGEDSVQHILQELKPMVKIKQPQLKCVLEIIEKLPTAKKDRQAFLKLCEKVDAFVELNDSKKRTITAETVRSELEN
jgi:hypothetical protein